MATFTKRIAAISLAASLGLAGIGTAAYAASPTATPSATPTASASATTSASATPSASTTAKSTATPSASVAAKKDVSFVGAYVEWKLNATTGTVTGKLTDDKGNGLSGVELTAYDYTGGKLGKKLGSGKTDSKGNFNFSVTIIGGADGSVDMALVYEGSDKYNKRMVTTRVKAGESGSMAPSKKATPSKDSKDKGSKEKQGGLASTGN